MHKHLARLHEGSYVPVRDLPETARVAREKLGLSHEEAAAVLETSPVMLEKAESQTYRHLFKLRRRILEELTGYTLEGPFYRIKKKAAPRGKSIFRRHRG